MTVLFSQSSSYTTSQEGLIARIYQSHESIFPRQHWLMAHNYIVVRSHNFHLSLRETSQVRIINPLLLSLLMLFWHWLTHYNLDFDICRVCHARCATKSTIVLCYRTNMIVFDVYVPATNNLENGSFRNRENLHYKKTADSVLLGLFMRANEKCNNSHDS